MEKIDITKKKKIRPGIFFLIITLLTFSLDVNAGIDVYPVYTIVGSKHVEGSFVLQQYSGIEYVDVIAVQGEIACLYSDKTTGVLTKIVIGGSRGMEAVRVSGVDILNFHGYVLSQTAAVTTIYYYKTVTRTGG